MYTPESRRIKGTPMTIRPGTVYSTDVGKICSTCSQPVTRCECGTQITSRPGSKDGLIRLVRETAGRKGKAVVVIKGLPLGDEELENLASALKKRCGSGGSVKGDTIEIQGEHSAALKEELTKRGYRVK